MPIDTTVDGDPDSVAAAARWLRGDLGARVAGCTDQVARAAATAGREWHGDAGTAFRAKAATGARHAQILAADLERVARELDRYAGELREARRSMATARRIAAEGQLTLTGTRILDPAGDEQVQAYRRAEAEADRARAIEDGARTYVRNVMSDVEQKKYFTAADFANGIVGELARTHHSILLAQAARLREEAALAGRRYLSAPGGSPEARAQTRTQFAKLADAAEVETRAAAVGKRVLGKVPLIGWGVTAAGIGYDIHNGKPAGKAVISGLGGAAAALAVGAAVGGPIGVGAVVGIGVGVLVGVGLDHAYDALPPGVRDGIDNGVDAVGDAVGGGAKKVWNSVFG